MAVSIPKLPKFASESGQSAVEYALVLPLVLVLLVGFVEFGFIFNYWNDEQHLASTGARFAAVNRVPSGSTLQAYVRSQADSGALRDGGTTQVPNPLQVCVDFPDGRTIGSPVTVSVRTTYHVAPALGFVDPNVTFAGHATMRLEAIPDSSTIPSGCA